MSEEEPTNEEMWKALSDSGQSFPMSEEKYNVHLFLHRVATADDTTKVGFLKEEEIGMPTNHIRGLKEFALISEKIIDNKFFKDYFLAESENVTATSLSREGFLVKQATTQTKRLADVTKTKKQNKGWFSKKDDDKKDIEQ